MEHVNDCLLWQRPTLRFFSDVQLQKIYEAALTILDRIGADFYDAEAVERLAGAGAYIQERFEKKCRVRIPAALVKRALQSAPGRVVLRDRLGRMRMILEGWNVYYGTGSDTPFTLDAFDDRRRQSVLQDVINAARLVDSLPNLDFCMCSAIASDVNAQTSDCHHFKAMVANTTKPLMTTGWSLENLKTIYEMMTVVKGSDERLQAEPFVMLYNEPVTPLTHPKESIQKLMFSAQKRFPIMYGPAPSRGSTAPVTSAGAFALGLSEVLGGLVLHQLVRPGAPFICGGGAGVMDMKTSIRPYAAPEQNLGRMFRTEMARYLNLPSWGAAGASDAKVIDGQACGEAFQQITLSSLLGANLIHDVGYLETGLTFSPVFLTICDEFISHTRRILKSAEISDAAFALDVIEEVGPGGHYLAHEHTYENFRREIWMPDLTDRNNRNAWEAAGSSTLETRAREKTQAILRDHEPQPLAAETTAQLEAIVAEYDKKFA